MEQLKEFMKGRPYDRDKDFEEAVIDYIDELEQASIERYEKLKEAKDIINN